MLTGHARWRAVEGPRPCTASAANIRDLTIGQLAYLTYGVSSTMASVLPAFFEAVEAIPDVVRDFSISQTTLEEVFIKVRSALRGRASCPMPRSRRSPAASCRAGIRQVTEDSHALEST